MKSKTKKLNNQVAKSIKYEIKPNKKQKLILEKFINDCRFTYNKGVECFNNCNISSFYDLRDEVVTNNYKKDLIIPNWLFTNVYIPDSIFETPKSIRSEEIKVLSTNIKSAFSNLKNKNIKKFKIGFKSKKKIRNPILNCEYSTSKIVRINNKQYLQLTKDLKILINTNKVLNLENDFKIQKTLNNKWFLILTKYINIKNVKNNSICALDPGIKTLLTGIDNNGNTFMIGKNITKRISKEKIKIANLTSEFNKLKNYKNKLYQSSKKLYIRYKNAKFKLKQAQEKFKFLIKELHNQSCNYLVKNYDIIIFPNFGLKEMISKFPKYLRKLTLSLSFYQLKERLKEKCKEYNKTLILTEEFYSSKTCSNCNNCNLLLTTERTFNCSFCKKVFDRDENASYNIFKNTILGVYKTKIF